MENRKGQHMPEFLLNRKRTIRKCSIPAAGIYSRAGMFLREASGEMLPRWGLSYLSGEKFISDIKHYGNVLNFTSLFQSYFKNLKVE